jgi:hypothetical protein
MLRLRRILLISVIGIALILSGCGGSSGTPNSNLTPAQAQSVGNAVYSSISDAIGSALGSVAAKATGKRLMRQLRPVQAGLSASCNSSDTSCSVSGSSACSGGGTISVSGSGSESINSSGNGSASAKLQMTPSSCDEGGIVLNGDPNITVSEQENLSDNNVVWPVTGSITGGVGFAPDSSGTAQIPSGTCSIDITFSVSESGSNVSCTIGGTVCGQALSFSCPASD